MTKTIKAIIWTLMILVLFTGASAGSVMYFPLPIAGKLNGEGVGDQLVEITNERTGEIMATKTTGAGEFLIDWANSDDRSGTIRKYFMGDVFNINVKGCTESYCSQKVTYNGETELFVSFNLMEANLLKEGTCSTDWMKLGAGMVITLIISLVGFMGGGLKIYKSRLGKTKFLHRHRGITEYHEPSTQHRNIKYRHRSWTKDPMGCIKDVKKIEEEGGMI